MPPLLRGPIRLSLYTRPRGMQRNTFGCIHAQTIRGKPQRFEAARMIDFQKSAVFKLSPIAVDKTFHRSRIS